MMYRFRFYCTSFDLILRMIPFIFKAFTHLLLSHKTVILSTIVPKVTTLFTPNRYTKNSNISLNTLLCRKNYVSSISNFDIERFQHKLKVTTRQLPISKPSLPEKTTTNAALNVLASAETSTKPDEASVAVTSEFAPADSTDADVDGLTLPPSSYQSILDASLKGSYFDGQLQDVLPSLLELTPVETAVLDISSVKAPAPDSILVEAVNCDQVIRNCLFIQLLFNYNILQFISDQMIHQ